jgi:hypothetical protein
MADPPATASTNSTSRPSPRPSSHPSPQLRSRTSQSRIDEILEVGRQRSIALGEPALGAPMVLSPEQSMWISGHEGPGGEGHESSADENTAIVRRESNKINDYQSTLRSRNSQQRPGPERRTPDAPQNTGTDEEQSWWKKQVEKYGSIELENKGSVARDHLALGMQLVVELPETYMLALRTDMALHRTYILSLAPHFTRVCLDRHCCHSTISTEYYNIK